MRPFRFGIVATSGTTGAAWQELARRVEAEGLSSLLVADHYLNEMSCGVLQMAAADATTTLRIGSYVYNNDFRHPALLAKEAATIDVLSGGRVEFGIGAGWHRGEYDQTGIPFEAGSVRVSRLVESIEIITALWRGQPVTYQGEHYRIDGFTGSPTPIQQPIPLMIGGGGPRMLKLAASRADIVALVPRSLPEGGLDPAEFTAEAFDSRIDALDEAIRASGRPDAPERGALVFQMYRTVRDVAPDDWMEPATVATSPYALVGDPARMIDTLVERRERWGISYLVGFAQDLELMIPVARALAGT